MKVKRLVINAESVGINREKSEKNNTVKREEKTMVKQITDMSNFAFF